MARCSRLATVHTTTSSGGVHASLPPCAALLAGAATRFVRDAMAGSQAGVPSSTSSGFERLYGIAARIPEVHLHLDGSLPGMAAAWQRRSAREGKDSALRSAFRCAALGIVSLPPRPGPMFLGAILKICHRSSPPPPPQPSLSTDTPCPEVLAFPRP